MYSSSVSCTSARRRRTCVRGWRCGHSRVSRSESSGREPRPSSAPRRAAAMPGPAASDSTVMSGRSAEQARPQVADLRDRRPARAVQLAADHQPAADAGAHRDVEHAARAAAGAQAGLGQRGHVAVVADHRRLAERFAAPARPAESRPSRRPDGSWWRCPRALSHGPPKPKPIRSIGCFCNQRRGRAFDLFENARRAAARIDVVPDERRQLAPSRPVPTPSCSFVPPISMPRNMAACKSERTWSALQVIPRSAFVSARSDCRRSCL